MFCRTRNGLLLNSRVGRTEALWQTTGESGRCTFPLDDKAFDLQQKAIIRLVTQGFSEQALSDVFSSRHGNFEESSIEIVWNREDFRSPRSYTREDGSAKVSIEYDGSEIVVTLDEVEENVRLIG